MKKVVSVDLTGYKPYYNHCSMDGTVVKRHIDGTVSVHLIGNNRTVIVPKNKISPTRQPEPDMQWKVGAHVQVLEYNNGVPGWWDAVIVQKSENGWFVQWKGDYEKHGDRSFVLPENIRRA